MLLSDTFEYTVNNLLFMSFMSWHFHSLEDSKIHVYSENRIVIKNKGVRK